MTPFAAGALAVAPTMAMVAPFGVVSGVAAAAGGLDLVQTMLLSIAVFAGASQLVIIELLTDHAPWFVVVATGLAVNLRFLMYSAALSPWFRGGTRGGRLAASYLLTDNSFGIALARYGAEARWGVSERIAFYLGAGALTWSVWQVGTVIGFVLGAATPAALGLDFLSPLAFIAIALPLLVDRPNWAAAAVGAGTAVAFRELPLNLNLIVAGIAGVAAGVIAEGLGRRGAR